VVETVVSAVVTGTVLGYVGKLLLPGRQDIPAWATVAAGIAAAFLGAVPARWLGLDHTAGIDWWEHIIQVIFAVIAIWFTARGFSGRRPGRTTTNY
jgi:uncharacterized membrane protein YeaQ/YmgE (transglycosylase-associated protein family)